MKKIIILTGNELRHKFFRMQFYSDKSITVLKSYCEGTEKSLYNRISNNPYSSQLMLEHVYARELSEKQFFKKLVDNNKNYSNKDIIIKKGEINNEKVVSDIIKLSPDLIICYGSSIINSSLLDIFKNKFINVHLGISPYYRGSGTNVWPMINNEFDLIGATFMFIDSGIDTGKIIHQIRADIKKNDDPHLIGNRLIKKMTKATFIL